MGEITFYKMNGKYYSRVASGPSREKIRHSPRFTWTRRRLTEFSICSSSGKSLRMFLRWHFEPNDKYNYRRLTSEFTKLLNFDTTSRPGERTPTTALATPAGRSFLKGFSFNLAKTPSVLIEAITFSSKDHIEIRDLNVLKRLFPKGAHTAQISAGAISLNLSFHSHDYISYSNKTLKHNELEPVFLIPQNNLVTTNPRFYIMQVTLFDKHNQPFRQGKSDLLFIIKVKLDKPAPKLIGTPIEFPETKKMEEVHSSSAYSTVQPTPHLDESPLHSRNQFAPYITQPPLKRLRHF